MPLSESSAGGPAPELIRDHLRTLLSLPEFTRAAKQAQVLRLLVADSMEGRRPTGSDLAERVHGRGDDPFVRAVQQTVREIRLKLPQCYRRLGPTPLSFDICEGSYEVRFVEDGAAHREDEVSVAAGTAPRSFGPRAARLRILVAAVALAGAAAGIQAWFGSGPESALPATVVPAADGFLAVDPDGNPLVEWTRRIGRVAAPLDEGGWVLEERLQVAAVGGGSTPATVVVATCNPAAPDTCSLILLAGRDGEVLGSLRLPLLPYPESANRQLHEVQGSAFGPSFALGSLHAVELDGDGLEDELVVAVTHRHRFPTQVLVLDGPDRPVPLLDHWTMGRARVTPLPDLDGDGRRELVVYGVNNAYQAASIALLPPLVDGTPRNGRSPDGQRVAMVEELRDYEPLGFTIRFPRTVLADPSRGSASRLRAEARDVLWNPESRELRIEVWDAADKHVGAPLRLAFVLDLARGTVSVDFIDYDIYLFRIKELIAAGRLDDAWNIESSGRLSRYAETLAAGVECFDPAGDARWRPLRSDDLFRIAGKAPIAGRRP